MTSALNNKSIDHTGNEIFKRYFRELYPKLMALSCRFVDEDIAKDMVQDAFVALWEQKGIVRNIPAFLYRSVQNNCLNYIKHDNVAFDYIQKVHIAESRNLYLYERQNGYDVFKQIEYSDLLSKIEIALEKLPPRTAEAFRLYYFKDLTAKEVAEVMKISYRTVEVHVQKALSQLKDELHGLLLLFLVTFLM